jgi:hypothetical protein
MADLIIGILAVVIIPTCMNDCERAKDAAVKGDFAYHGLSLCSVVVLGRGSLGLGDTDYAIRVA